MRSCRPDLKKIAKRGGNSIDGEIPFAEVVVDSMTL